MFETLYRTNSPKTFTDGEYFQPSIDQEFQNEREVFFVREKHGWYSVEQQRAANHLTTYKPDEPFNDQQGALSWYEEQLRYRASQGFVYAASFDPFVPGATSWRVLDPKAPQLRKGHTVPAPPVSKSKWRYHAFLNNETNKVSDYLYDTEGAALADAAKYVEKHIAPEQSWHTVASHQ
jgi:hypothetical protein